MVQVGNAPVGGKSMFQLLKEVQEHRKIQHRSFTRFSDGDTYVVLMFAHDESDELVVVFANCAMPQLKSTLPYWKFKLEFEQQVEHVQPVVKRERKE